MVRPSISLTVLLLAAGLFSGSDAVAQQSRTFSFRDASNMGLTSMWSRAITVGRAGEVTGLTVHVSRDKTYQASEVIDKFGRRVFFSDRELLGTSRAGYDQTSRLADIKRAELEARGLEPRLELKTIPDVTLYVRSSLGTVIALDAETGRELWTAQAGKSGYPNYPVSASDQHVVTLSGSTIYIIDAPTGQIVDSIRTRKAPGAAPTLHGDYIYVPTTQGLIEVYLLSDTSHVDFTMGSSGRIENPVTVSPDSVSWTTDQGYLYVGNVGRPGINYRFRALDTITSAPIYMDETLYATSIDGFTYAIAERDGAQEWSYSLGGSTSGAPLALEGNIYVTTTDGQMACLEAETGKAAWRAGGVNRFVSLSQSRLYCVTPARELAALDRQTGELLSSAPVGSLALPIVNTTTDRIYLIHETGILQSLRETAQRWPTVRMPPVKEDPAEADQGEQPATPPAATVPPSTPTAEEAAEDPFRAFDADATDDAADEAFPADDEDPFSLLDDATDDSTDDEAAEEDPFADFE